MNLAPNGQPSNLTPEQYRLVRTPAFKNWFGDWENSPETSSKVVDENGEPLIKYRGDNNPKNVFDYINYGGHGVYYFGDEGFAESFGDKLNSYFINSRNPFIPNKLTTKEKKEIEDLWKNDAEIILKEEMAGQGYGEGSIQDLHDYLENYYLWDKETGWFLNKDVKMSYPDYNFSLDILLFVLQGSINFYLLERKEIIDWIKNNNYDGYESYEGNNDNIAVFNSNQIKLSDGTNTTFDSNNPDIRYNDGGEIIVNDGGDNSGSIKLLVNNEEIGILKYFYDLDSSFSETLSKYSSELYIESVDVVKKYRGKGIATKLLKEVINTAKKLEIDVVSLRRSSGMGCDYGGKYDFYLKAIYERIGFVENNEDCGMILELNKKFKDGGEIKNLVVLHNINSYQIEQSDKLGGLISPSIAILKAGDKFTDFGTITLIADKDLINPETTGAKVYSGDVYSPSVPRKYYYVNNIELEKKQNELITKAREYDDISNSDSEVYSLVSSSFGKSSDFDKDLNKYDLDDLIRINYDNFKIVYLVDKGIKIKIPQKEKKHYLWNNVSFTLTDEQKNRFKPILIEYNKESNEKGSLGISKEIKSKVFDLFLEVFEPIIQETIAKYDDEKAKKYLEKTYRESFEKNVGTRYSWGGWAEYNLSKAVYGEKVLDTEKLKENIQKVFTPKIRKDYDTWLKNFISQFKGSAYFESGKSKLPYTLENLIDETTKSVVGQEKTLTFGVNKAKSFSFKRLNTIQEIKDNAGKLVSKDKMNEIDKENEQSFYNLASRLKYAYSSEWEKLNSLAKAVADFFKGKSAYSALSKNDFVNITSYDTDRLKDFANQIRKSPVDYFEAKLGRAVKLSEFKFAVVPEKTTKEIIDILKKNGLKVKKYSNDEQRMEIVNDIVNRNKLVFKQGGTIIKKPKSLSKTPAPAKERIYGSKINKPKSSESKEKAKSIVLSDKVVNSIKSIIEKHNKEFTSKKIPLETAKAVVRRGMGAYSSTHRPTISGGKPNSRIAWGLARLNAFVYKIQKGKSKSGKYKQDDDLIGELGYKVKNYENGGEIILSIEQIEQILERKLHWWDDSVVYIDGTKYTKMFLKPFYKLG